MSEQADCEVDYSQNPIVRKLGLRKVKPIMLDGQPAVVAECGTILSREELAEAYYVPTPDEIERYCEQYRRLYRQFPGTTSNDAAARIRHIRELVARLAS